MTESVKESSHLTETDQLKSETLSEDFVSNRMVSALKRALQTAATTQKTQKIKMPVKHIRKNES